MLNAYEQIAVTNLASYLLTNLPTYLRAVETEDSLANESLTNPVDYVRASVPMDPRFPLIQIFDVDCVPAEAGHRNKLAHVAVHLYITDAVAGTDVQGAEDKCRRYVRAIRNCIAADYRLGTTGQTDHVVAAVWTQAERTLHETFENVARVGRAIIFDIEVQAP